VLTLPPTVRVFLAIEPADMRRSLDGLAALTREVLKQDPLSGHLFVFRNRRSDRVKVLVWDRSGLCLWYKRLERGRFTFPTVDGPEVEVEAAELSLLLEGIDLAGAKRRPRFTPQRATTPRNP
jgi:transposase